MNETSFLEHVAKDLLSKHGTDLSRMAVVFPNKRAALFMNEFLARNAEKPVWSPTYMTISELFGKQSEYALGDSIKLICDLHKSFVKCTGLAEDLDHFYGWGQLLLSDFDDVDKNMADAERVFSNLKDIHELDDISYLDEEQRDILKKFFANFTEDKETELKKKFLSLWCHFGDIYADYRDRLKKQGLMYEGALYRDVVENKDLKLDFDQYVFVGFNLLHTVERQLFSTIKKLGKALFYWDFDNYYMPKPGRQHNPSAGTYIAQYLDDFPCELDIKSEDVYDNMKGEKHMTYISASSENAQARFAGNWLMENNRYKAGKKTAIVMCDENILLPLMHSLPEDINKVNITSGYPLATTPIFSFVSQLYNLYTLGMRQNGQSYGTSLLSKVMGHPYAGMATESAADLLKEIKERRLQYLSVQYLATYEKDEGMGVMFSQLPKANEGMTYNSALLGKLSNIVKRIGITGAQQEKDAFFQEAVFRMYTVLNRLKTLTDNGDLDVDQNTLRRLIRQIMTTTAIPFHGEPIVGIQIMGVLETRNLDFDNLLILSCNEGNMPKGVNDSSFIPYAIRKAYGLTTIDNKVAIYSYYFHRLIQRAGNVTIMYNEATENGHTGEMSRFMLQLMVDGSQQIKHASLSASNATTPIKRRSICKDKNVMSVLDGMKSMSPSAVNKYIRCPLQFFFQYVANVKEPECNDEDIDNRMFGNIFHKAAQFIYEDIASHNNNVVTDAFIDKYIDNEELLGDVVDKAFSEVFFKTDISKGKVSLNGLQIINREVIMTFLQQMLRHDRANTPFNILALETAVYEDVRFTTPSDGKQRKLEVGGIIDRLDMVKDRKTGEDVIRVLDYKTGRQPKYVLKNVEEVFNAANISSKHSDYYLQTLMYALNVRGSRKLNPAGLKVAPALMFVKQTVNKDYDPILYFDKERIMDVLPSKTEYTEHLKDVLKDIFDPSVSFTPTKDKKTCDTCAFQKICGR